MVADLVRGLGVEEALVKLQFANKAAAKPLAKLLQSAISNAEETYNLQKDNLLISELKVNAGPTLHRWRPRAFGRANPIRKRMSHIDLVLTEKVPTKKPIVKKSVVTQDDLIKVDSIDEIKSLNQDSDKDKKEGKVKKDFNKSVSSGKSFVGKMFNRKSGEK